MNKPTQVVIFCGGFGTRFNNGKPGLLKPLVKINGMPILKRIISIYSKEGVRNFLLLGGYKFKELKKFEIENDRIKIKAINTGVGSSTAARLLKAKKHINFDFFLTYGDSLSDFSVKKALNFKKKNKDCYIASYFDYKVPYGVFSFKKSIKQITQLNEKDFTIPINAGFYILDRRIFNFIKSEKDVFEKEVLARLLKNKKPKLIAFKLNSWHPMDTKSDKYNMEHNYLI